jgi:hypothetical protein
MGWTHLKDWKPDREELAWAGGFLCGEGCFHADPRPRVEVVQNEPEVLRRFGAAIGGLGGLHGGKKIYGSLTKKPMYKWRVSGFERVQAVAAMLWPWLSEAKRSQVRIVLKNGYHPSRLSARKGRQDWARNAALTRTRDSRGRFS